MFRFTPRPPYSLGRDFLASEPVWTIWRSDIPDITELELRPLGRPTRDRSQFRICYLFVLSDCHINTKATADLIHPRVLVDTKLQIVLPGSYFFCHNFFKLHRIFCAHIEMCCFIYHCTMRVVYDLNLFSRTNSVSQL